MNKIFVPPIKIQGIKTKLVPLIKENIKLDKNTVWVEPFMGSGVVGFNVCAEQAVFADINPHIIQFYQQIKNKQIDAYIVRQFLEENGQLLSQKGQDFYYEIRNRFNENHSSLDFLFLNRSCFNGMIRFNKDYKFNVPYGHKDQRFAKAYITKIVNQVKYIEECLQNFDWHFYCQSFEKTIQQINENSFIYCDPPYIGRHIDYYDSWNEDLEINLKEILLKSKAKFMLSTWDKNIYRTNECVQKIWGFCNKITQQHFYHIGAKEKNRNSIIEALMTNYEKIPLFNHSPIYQQPVLFS